MLPASLPYEGVSALVLKASRLGRTLSHGKGTQVAPKTPKQPRWGPLVTTPEFHTIPVFQDEADLVNLRLVKAVATTLGYNLAALYSHLVEEGHNCVWFDDRNVLHFELSHRTWREQLLSTTQAARPSIDQQLRLHRVARSKSADAHPPGVKHWLQAQSFQLPHKLPCFVFSSGAVVIWGLKSQLCVRSHNTPHQHRNHHHRMVDLESLKNTSQRNTVWNNVLVSDTVWFLSQFAGT
eukprot:Protomagalhaensia_sp_Gyna_25__5412@NODE_701_length_2813_cov_801_123648_g547_i0_p1_GENE_NODE_701_length_2813_cov_801_123648_g547_i0NODE_701_length_2813_cov_801_123648_g547_i0_p1_ORF_typecomplete_len237_score14_51DUF155/PF02582_14/0_034TBP/PF00352_21/0_38_NODE_701_length_2813_cov_801_123648_g547_i020922802